VISGEYLVPDTEEYMSARLVLSLMIFGASVVATQGVQAETIAPPSGFAVVELFTSEGCSSCPPADEVLSSIARTAEQEDLAVYPLEWHVDYWDYLGWKDPFDSRFATERQYAYARSLPSSVYTPQMVLNGAIVPEYAGDTVAVDKALRSLLKLPAAGTLRISIIPAGAQSIRVHVDVNQTFRDSVLLLVVTEDGLSATPTAGENAGSRLAHSSVVRSVKVLPAHSLDEQIDVPTSVDVSRASLIGILQERKTMRILGAARAAVPRLSSAGIIGRVVDSKGTGIGGVRIEACSGVVCVPSATDANGSFVFSGLAPGRYSIAFVGNSSIVEIAVKGGQVATLRQPLLFKE
jgi:hypothetical protein